MGVRAAAAVATVVVVLAGGAVVADHVVRTRTEADLAQSLQDEIPGLDTEPDVTIHGFPFLTQVMSGSLDDVRLSAPEATVEGLRMEDIDVRLEGVSTDQPTTADRAHMTALVTLDSAREVLDAPVELSVEDGALVTSTQFLGLPVEAVLVPRAAGRDIDIEVQSLRLAGVGVDPSQIPGIGGRLEGLSIPVQGLPEGLELTGLTVDTEGFWLEAEGTDVVFEPLAG